MVSLGYSFDNTLGAALVGFAVSCFAHGIYTAQCYRYFRRFPSDRPAYKMLVIGLWLLETVDQMFIGHAIYFYMVTNFADPLALIAKPVVWSVILQIAFGALGGAIVKGCFAMRVWRFSNHNIIITAVILLLTCTQLCFAIVYTAKGFSLAALSLPVATDTPDLKLWATLSLSVGAGTDILTAVALCWFLRKLRTGYKRSDNLVNSLTIFAVNTGALTSAVSLATLILYNAMPQNFIYMGVYFVLSKLYVISFLATLNTRKIIRGRGTDEHDATYATGNTFYTYGQSQRRPHAAPNSDGLKALEVGVHHEVSISSDGPPDYAVAW